MFLTTNMECDHCCKVINGPTYSTSSLIVQVACKECFDEFNLRVWEGERQAAIDHEKWLLQNAALRASMSQEEYDNIPDHVIFAIH